MLQNIYFCFRVLKKKKKNPKFIYIFNTTDTNLIFTNNTFICFLLNISSLLYFQTHYNLLLSLSDLIIKPLKQFNSQANKQNMIKSSCIVSKSQFIKYLSTISPIISICSQLLRVSSNHLAICRLIYTNPFTKILI